MSAFALAVISILFLLLTASLSFILAKKTRFPFTIMLFILGMALYGVAQFVPALGVLDAVKLTPDIIFYIFLPTLLFESAYKISYRRFVDDAQPIFALAVVSLAISAFIIAGAAWYLLPFLGLDIPFIVLLMFGALISATDPVAVLALFKDFGVPGRLELIFEGESVFNDGTALAMFLVILEAAKVGIFTTGSIVAGTVTFFSMIILGMVYGAIVGFVFSKVIQKVNNESWVEITMMLVMAHFTFISAELISHALAHSGIPGGEMFRISPVIATALAAMTLGNYGRQKISPAVEKAMDLYWGYFAFICNSLIFLMMGYFIASANIPWTSFIWPSLLIVAIVAVGRAISIYGVVMPMNLWLANKIPMNWQHLLSYGSLRGGLAIAMVLSIPATFTVAGWSQSYSVYEFLLAITFACILFTLLIKATTFAPLMKALGVGNYTHEEELTDMEARKFINNKILLELDKLGHEGYVLPKTRELVTARYAAAQNALQADINALTHGKLQQSTLVDIIAKYALGLEQHLAAELYGQGQLNERVMRVINAKIDDQYWRLEQGHEQISPIDAKPALLRRAIDWIGDTVSPQKPHEKLRDKYLYYLAREKMCAAIQGELAELMGCLDQDDMLVVAFRDIIARYAAWQETASKKRRQMAEHHGSTIEVIDMELTERIAGSVSENILQRLHGNHIVSEKVYHELHKEMGH